MSDETFTLVAMLIRLARGMLTALERWSLAKAKPDDVKK
jgi:hypothetical protein